MRFEGFYGNTSAKEQLSSAFDSGRPPHAILIDGPEGSGKRTLAGIIAQAAVCEGGGELPCGKCRQCVNARSGGHPDITSYTGTGGARSFSIKTVRQVRMDASILPNDAAKKVYILADAHDMGIPAQNALLKIIEEPPSYVMFILTCVGRSRLLSTIQSRVSLVSLSPVTQEETVQALMDGNPALTQEKAIAAARMSGGIIGRAKQGLEEGSFLAAEALSGQFANALCASDQYRFLRLSGTLEKEQALSSAFIELLPLLFRDACAAKVGMPADMSGCADAALKLAGSLTQKQLFKLTQCSLESVTAVERYTNKMLLLTNLFLKLWQHAHDTQF
jgi:DNA polymerase III gamma/tau subunit